MEAPELPHFDLENMAARSTILVVAHRGGQKSLLMKQLNLAFPTERFLAWTAGSKDNQAVLATYADNSHIMDDGKWDLESIIAGHRQTCPTPHYAPLNCSQMLTVMFDDVRLPYDQKLMQDTAALKQLIFNVKESNARVMMSSQDVHGIMPSIRDNLDYIFLGKQPSRLVDVAWQKFFQRAVPDYSTFYAMYREYTSKNRFLVLDTMMDECYQFKVDPSVQGKMPALNADFLAALNPSAHSIRVKDDIEVVSTKDNPCFISRLFGDCLKSVRTLLL